MKSKTYVPQRLLNDRPGKYADRVGRRYAESSTAAYKKKYGQDKKWSGKLVPVKLADGTIVKLSPGKHNAVHVGVIEQFAPRFAPGSIVFYLGGTSQKNLILDKQHLDGLGLSLCDHNKLSDVVLFDPKKKRLFLIEAVPSHGPMTPKRVHELSRMFQKADAGLVFVSALPDFNEFTRHSMKLAWKTHVWIAEFPDHMIHYNGDKFLGPR